MEEFTGTIGNRVAPPSLDPIETLQETSGLAAVFPVYQPSQESVTDAVKTRPIIGALTKKKLDTAYADTRVTLVPNSRVIEFYEKKVARMASTITPPTSSNSISTSKQKISTGPEDTGTNNARMVPGKTEHGQESARTIETKKIPRKEFKAIKKKLYKREQRRRMAMELSKERTL